jgi:outer membrane protein OmpA-like peptidoglycan-associated protein
MNGTWRAQGFAAWAGRSIQVVAVTSLLGGCSMFESKPTPGEAAATGQPYPNLGTVPTQAPPTSSSADRTQTTQGLVADQQNAAYTNDQLKAQPGAGSVPPPASAQPSAVPGTSETTTTTGAAAGTAATTTTTAAATPPAAAPTPPAAGTVPASPSVEQSTLPPPSNTATQTASTAAPATVPYGTPMPAASSQAPAADAPHYASPYYPLPVAGAPTPYAPAPGQVAPVQTASAQLPPSAAPIVIQDQAKLASILGAGTPLLPGQAGGTSAAAVQQPPIAVIFFRAGSAGLSSRDYSVLHDVMLLQQQQGGQLRVIGHASERTETTDYATHQAINENLSLKRASAVGGALLQMGVPGSAVAISAVGGQGPIFYEFMPTGEAGNRRVEIFLVR